MKTKLGEGQFAVRDRDVLTVMHLIGDYNRSGEAPLGVEIFVNGRVLAGSGLFELGITFGASIALEPIHYPNDGQTAFKYTIYQNELAEVNNDGQDLHDL